MDYLSENTSYSKKKEINPKYLNKKKIDSELLEKTDLGDLEKEILESSNLMNENGGLEATADCNCPCPCVCPIVGKGAALYPGSSIDLLG